MKFMNVGYNLVEANKVREKYEKIEQEMSIIQFLRTVKKRQEIPKKIAVVGLDGLLSYGDEVRKYVRKILSNAADYLMQKNITVQFLIYEKLVIDREPKIRLVEKEIRLAPIFGNRLTQKDVEWYHSPFNI